MAQRDDYRSITQEVGQGLAPFGADDDVDLETFRCRQEVLGPIGLGG
jgi:hypothetical protein